MAKKEGSEKTKTPTIQEQVRRILEDKSLGEYDRIRAIYKLGFSRKQLQEDFHYPKSSVYDAVPVEPEEKDRDKGEEQPKSVSLMKMGTRDMVPPEQALSSIRLQDGEYKKGFVDGMGTLIMAARYNQILSASQADIVRGQMEIMRESKESGVEMARQASLTTGQEIAGRLFDFMEQRFPKKVDIASVPNPFEGVFARAMESTIEGFTKKLLGVPPEQGSGLPPGWSDNREQGGQ